MLLRLCKGAKTTQLSNNLFVRNRSTPVPRTVGVNSSKLIIPESVASEYAGGATLTELAVRYHCNPSTIRERLAKLGVERDRNRAGRKPARALSELKVES